MSRLPLGKFPVVSVCYLLPHTCWSVPLTLWHHWCVRSNHNCSFIKEYTGVFGLVGSLS